MWLFVCYNYSTKIPQAYTGPINDLYSFRYIPYHTIPYQPSIKVTILKKLQNIHNSYHMFATETFYTGKQPSTTLFFHSSHLLYLYCLSFCLPSLLSTYLLELYSMDVQHSKSNSDSSLLLPPLLFYLRALPPRSPPPGPTIPACRLPGLL